MNNIDILKMKQKSSHQKKKIRQNTNEMICNPESTRLGSSTMGGTPVKIQLIESNPKITAHNATCFRVSILGTVLTHTHTHTHGPYEFNVEYKFHKIHMTVEETNHKFAKIAQ